MKLDNMFKKTRRPSGKKGHIGGKHQSPEVPEGLLCKCNKCQKAIITEDVITGGYICPKCHGYFRMPAPERIRSIADEDTFEEWDRGIENTNPIGYKGYPEKVEALKQTTGLDEAVVTGKVAINGIETALGVCDGRFLMASMGEVVGEKITRMVERATEEKLPVIIFTCSGGARMQEGIVSLMQMAKTSAAIKRHSEAGLLYTSILTDPTTGGVTASFAMLGDIIIAFTAFCNILPSLHYVLGLAARHQVTTILKWPKTIVYFPYVVMIAILMLYALVEIYEYIMVLCGNAYYIEKMKNEDKSEAEHAIEESLAQENIDLTSIDFSSGHGGSTSAPENGKNDVNKTDDAGKEDK